MLPPELWSTVCRLLDRKDLARVARTSWQLSAAARPVLYRTVYLCSNKDGVQATFDLLKSDRFLASKVIDIHIFTTWPKDGEEQAWLDLDAFYNLVHLRSMTMTGSPFQTAVEQDTFLEIVKRSCPLLKEFTYRQGRYPSPPLIPGPYPTKFPSHNFRIVGIEKLVWDDNASLIITQPQLRSLINVSLQTIIHLAIPSEFDDFGVADATTFFGNSRIPQLRSFELGNWVDFNGEAGPVALTQFLVAHPTIQDLNLSWDDTSEYTSEISVSAVTTNMLPNLRHLRSHVFNVLVLLRGAVHSLDRLVKLSVGHGLHSEAEGEIDEMLEGLISRGGLPCLKSLHFDPGEGCTDLQNTQQWMSQWSRICPGLQKWSGSLVDMDGIELDTLISSFSEFSRLQRIELAYTILPRGAEDVAIIASGLSSLRKITVCPAGELNILRTTYHIQRNNLGAVSQLIIRKHSIYDQISTLHHNIVM